MTVTHSPEQVRAAQCQAAPWPYQDLDVSGLRLEGRHRVPLGELILKVHQRCNLACDYCYVYEHADQSWRDRPAAMPDAVRRAAVAALGRHVRTHRLPRVRVILHGGEPLLYGSSRLASLADEVRAELPADCAVEVGIQTNGVLLDEPTIRLLRQHRIRVGVSVDGVGADHDRHRRTPAGRGSFAAVRRALDTLRKPEHRSAYAGLLCTVAPDTDPLACYEQLIAFDPPMIDFLLPHANWQRRPWRPGGSATPYADWLAPIFDRWYATPDPTRIRLFEDVVTLLLGGHGRSEQLGLSPSAVLVVETDGAIEQVDALKSAYPGACATGLDVLRHELDTALDDPGVVARQIGVAALAPECLACPVHRVCGGGHYAHRYRPGKGFRNRSVYCEDLSAFISHVRERVSADIQRQVAVTR